VKNFWIMFLLILPACTNSLTKTQDIVSCSVLCPRPVASFHQGYSDPDQAFFRMLESMIPHPGPHDIVIVQDHFSLDQLVDGMRKVTPGGFLFVMNFDVRVYRIMKRVGWNRLPFMWSDFEIYRRPLEISA
jgi:hypothetical protein